MKDLLRIASALLLAAALARATPRTQWSEAQANEWYEQEPWLVGSNYIPSNAINQLAMWQRDTFNPALIDKELGWAQGLGMNTMRVFLHDLAWQQDAAGFKKRIDQFLRIAAKHRIRPMLVIFDSCWNPNPKLGPQPAPTPGVHNSGWVQSPGAQPLTDQSQWPRLEAYVKGVVGAFANDKRILAWDLWNEPDNMNDPAYINIEPKDKKQAVAELLPKVFDWARAAGASQPLTSGVWQDDWSSLEKLSPTAKIQLTSSDIITFHNYGPPAEFRDRIGQLAQFHRPEICTEYMARPQGSTFEAILPVAKQGKVGAINWGFVAGKTQTYLPWDSWKHPYTDRQPPVWFHDIFHTDGKPYRAAEVETIRELTGKASHADVTGN